MLGAAVLALQHSMTFAFRDFLNGNGDSPGILPTNPALDRLGKFHVHQYAGGIIYMPTIGVIKLSLLAFYSRFLPRRPYRPILIALAAVVVCFVTATTLAGIFGCKPIAAAWDKTIPGAVCSVGVPQIHLGNAIFNIITDLVILAAPVTTVLRLHADLKKRIGLCIIFSMGLVATSITIVRTVNMFVIVKSNPMLPATFFPKVINNIMWSAVEIGLLILCANLPSMYALVLRPTLNSSASQSHATYSNSKGPRAGLQYDPHGVRRKDASVSASAFGQRATTTTSSEEHIVSPEEGIHMSTRVVINRE